MQYVKKPVRGGKEKDEVALTSFFYEMIWSLEFEDKDPVRILPSNVHVKLPNYLDVFLLQVKNMGKYSLGSLFRIVIKMHVYEILSNYCL